MEKLSAYSDLDILIHRPNAIALRNYLKNHPLISQLKILKKMCIRDRYRIVVKIEYKKQWIFIRFIGTHQDYDKINANEI